MTQKQVAVLSDHRADHLLPPSVNGKLLVWRFNLTSVETPDNTNKISTASTGCLNVTTVTDLDRPPAYATATHTHTHFTNAE